VRILVRRLLVLRRRVLRLGVRIGLRRLLLPVGILARSGIARLHDEAPRGRTVRGAVLSVAPGSPPPILVVGQFVVDVPAVNRLPKKPSAPRMQQRTTTPYPMSPMIRASFDHFFDSAAAAWAPA